MNMKHLSSSYQGRHEIPWAGHCIYSCAFLLCRYTKKKKKCAMGKKQNVRVSYNNNNRITESSFESCFLQTRLYSPFSKPPTTSLILSWLWHFQCLMLNYSNIKILVGSHAGHVVDGERLQFHLPVVVVCPPTQYLCNFLHLFTPLDSSLNTVYCGLYYVGK